MCAPGARGAGKQQTAAILYAAPGTKCFDSLHRQLVAAALLAGGLGRDLLCRLPCWILRTAPLIDDTSLTARHLHCPRTAWSTPAPSEHFGLRVEAKRWRRRQVRSPAGAGAGAMRCRGAITLRAAGRGRPAAAAGVRGGDGGEEHGILCDG